MPTRTAAEQRDERRAAYNANLRDCPGHEVLAALSDKWLTLVVAALADGPLRYNQLRRVVAGATQKMLTQTVRRMERDGLVLRTVTSTVPVTVEYELTPLGRDLLPLQQQIKAWAEAHIAQVHQARAAYDGRQPRSA